VLFFLIRLILSTSTHVVQMDSLHICPQLDKLKFSYHTCTQHEKILRYSKNVQLQSVQLEMGLREPVQKEASKP